MNWKPYIVLIGLLTGLACDAQTQPPECKLIHLFSRPDITNGKVKQVLADGVLFKCDQGLVKASFDELPPQFRSYYSASATVAQRKADQDQKEMEEILASRAKAAERLIYVYGQVLYRENGYLVLNCPEPGRYYSPPRDRPCVFGTQVVRDDELYSKFRVRDWVKIMGVRGDDVTTSTGEQFPCYTVVQRFLN